jgi:flagellin-like hook-associated protein FlgL
VDLGFGLQFDGDGNIVPQSAYNTSLPGISIIGYGMNDDGTPKNVYSLMGKIADLLDSDNVSMDTIQPYLDSFRQTESNITTQISDIGAKEKFLTSTQTHLKDTSGNLTEKDNDVEFVEPSDAIMDWMTQQFCYQAALQMGTNILQPTLMDFLK